MTEDKGILIKNIYYMLTYAFQVLRQTNYEEIASEQFDEIQDLFAAILSKGIGQQLKQGLQREYISVRETRTSLRGKIDMPETVKNRIQHKRIISCEYDELSENNLMNQILKTTADILLRSNGVTAEHKNSLKKVLLFFDGIDTLEPSSIQWNRIQIQRSNKSYEMLINICYFVIDGMLQTTDKGNYRMAQFSDEHMARLYERFVLEYYRHHHKELSASAGQVKWNLSNDSEESAIKYLPTMQTDIMLKNKEHTQTLIIDTKYYTRTMQSQFDTYSYHSGNLYQIFTYVKNQDANEAGNVSGMLLYAKTGESITPNAEFMMSGNKISVKTLDLNLHFSQIAAQLDKIAIEHFGKDRSDIKK